MIATTKSIGAPLYEQVRRTIEVRIDSGVYRRDEPLPSIAELAREMDVSGITIRRAIEELKAAGKARSVPGVGIFVAGRKRLLRHVGPQYGSLNGVSDDATASGRRAESKLLGIEYRRTDDPILDGMGFPHERCLTFKKIILLDGEPISLDFSFVHGTLSDEMVDAFSKDFIWKVLKERRIAEEHTSVYFDAAPATEEFSRELGAPLGYPTIRSIYHTRLADAAYQLAGICMSPFDAIGYHID